MSPMAKPTAGKAARRAAPNRHGHRPRARAACGQTPRRRSRCNTRVRAPLRDRPPRTSPDPSPPTIPRASPVAQPGGKFRRRMPPPPAPAPRRFDAEKRHDFFLQPVSMGPNVFAYSSCGVPGFFIPVDRPSTARCAPRRAPAFPGSKPEIAIAQAHREVLLGKANAQALHQQRHQLDFSLRRSPKISALN